MPFTPPVTEAEFKDLFDRDFPYGEDLDSVRDKDITRALMEARTVFNSGLWADVDEKKTAYLYASAHFLHRNLQMAGGLGESKNGLAAQAEGAMVSSSVGQVSVNVTFPDSVLKSPKLSQLLLSPYGQKYLQMVAPRLTGNVMCLEGFSEFDEFK